MVAGGDVAHAMKPPDRDAPAYPSPRGTALWRRAQTSRTFGANAMHLHLTGRLEDDAGYP